MKTSFVFSGGGAMIAYLTGIAKQLANRGINPNASYGVSAGALISEALSYIGVDRLIEILLGIKGNSDIIERRWSLGLGDSIYDSENLKKLIDAVAFMSPGSDAKLCEAICCAVNLKKTVYNGKQIGAGIPCYFSNFEVDRKTFAKMVLASASIPVAMSPVDDLWVDGGVCVSTPLNKAIQDGANRIYVMLCNPYLEGVWDDWDAGFPGTASIGLRTVDLMNHRIFWNDVEKCRRINTEIKAGKNKPGKRLIELHVYAPERRYLDTLEFDPAKIHEAYNAGLVAEELQFGDAA